MADLFAGAGGVARKVRAQGFLAREWEKLHCEEEDLTRPCVLKHLRQECRKGRILAAMLAPPCKSMSCARDRTKVIRDRDHPWGRPGLTPDENQQIDIANTCWRAAITIIKMLHSHKILDS